MEDKEQEFFRKLIQQVAEDFHLSSTVIERICQYRALVLEENEKQNLTRLITPQDFFEGHIRDCLELRKWGRVGKSVLDVGSGGGVPGLVCAILEIDDAERRQWILSDSEISKADFLQEAVSKLNLQETVRVFAGRAEEFLKAEAVQTIVVRAVAKIEKLLRLFSACSTWNNAFLFKGPAWKSEWEAVKPKDRKCVAIKNLHEYSVSKENKKRVIIELEFVPRGTVKSNKT